uniref:Uncharacterized protein n=1 Tax=Heterorhabditis bacteriophora TaxID=37862 RepID=A0A1I7XK42_HETBA
MIPEFPLPPQDADFYHSKLHERPPLFGVLIKTPILLAISTPLFVDNHQLNPIVNVFTPSHSALRQPMKATTHNMKYSNQQTLSTKIFKRLTLLPSRLRISLISTLGSTLALT